MTFKKRLSATTMLTLISFSSLALAQPATATTRPVDGRLRTSHGVTIYPQLPTNQHQLRRGYFTRQPINTAFKITQQHRGLGGFYFHIIGNRFNGWVAARTVIPLIKHLTRQQFKTPVNRAAKLSIYTTTLPFLTNRQLQLIMTHQLSTRQMNQLHLRVGKPIRTTRGQYIQILGPQGRHIRVSVNKMPLRFTLPTSHQSQHLITPTKTVMPLHAKTGNTLTTSKSGTTTTGQSQNPNNTVKFRHAENSPAGHPQHVNAPTPVTPPNQKSTSTLQGNHFMGTPVKSSAQSNDHHTIQRPVIVQPHATIRLHSSAATAPTHQAPVNSVATPANAASSATTTQPATTAGTVLRHQQIHTNQIATATRPASQPSTSISPVSQVPIRTSANSTSTQVSQATSTQTDHKTVTSAATTQSVAVTSSKPTATGTSVVSQNSATQPARHTTTSAVTPETVVTPTSSAATLTATSSTSTVTGAPGTTPVNTAPVTKYTAQQALQAINQLMTTNHFMGTLLLTNNGPAGVKTLTLGSADLNQHLANTVDESYPLASLEKSVTGAIIQHLINAGKLTMNTTLAHFYPQVPYAQSITIRQLLDHTSGIQMGEPVPDQALSTDQQAIDFTLQHLTSTNQHQWSYSNANFTLLAGIVDQLTGQSFSANLEADILQPLNMQHTFVYNQIPATAVHPLPYTFSKGASTPRSISTNLLSSELGCGNLYASVGDFYTFIHNLVDGHLLTSAGFRELAANLQPTYSGGIYYRDDGTIRIGGADNSLYSLYIGSNDSKIAMVFFANQAKWATMNTVGVQIEKILAQSALL
ncbi:serine hydrolase domain-containing protein [Lactiplantibacillus plantarum]|uniref:serine hydrolase domain-containing protein n=1 Tax=Lactiplantibacillus plantarum TaxID=1590 RepID=UPI001364077F|nr:serine hydrolase domain-containing protein [Lactiplantibacillus plantarum]MCS8588880.1 class A beta-lactamase-related serine hydrolase [Lactiplantibacillus plantarum]QHM41954.1 Putative penicillin-binding protein PbpX [Lactiplantibacillus plantarum]QHM49128.1 Putative penicillin-binding protein PbpX [Lactiplantibacillus plantarum]